MEAYLPPTHYEPRSGLLTLLLTGLFVMANVIAAYIAASYAMTTKSRPQIGMTKGKIRALVREAVRGDIAPLQKRMAGRECLLDEAIEMAHLHEVRITALEDDYNKAMKEIDSLRISNNHAPPSPSEHSSRASSHRHDESDGDSIYGGEDYESPPQEPSPPDQAHDVSSPQLDKETSDELAEPAGWGLDDEASEDVRSGNTVDQDVEGATDEDEEDEEDNAPAGLGRPAFKPLSKCRAKRAPARPE